jgi:hypothetical protein
VSFFNDIKGEGLLKKNAARSLRRAQSTLEKTVDNGFTPYYNGTSHLKSLAYPVIPVLQLARNALRLTYSAVVFASALLSLNGHGAANAVGSMLNIILASVLEVLNAAFSIISFATRSIASAVNLGYTSAQTAYQNEHYPKCAGQRNRKDVAAREEANIVHETTFALV